MSDDTDRINVLERLPRRRTPERDLWPGIAAQLAPRRSLTAALRAAVRHYPLTQVALAASLVAGLAAVFTLGLRDATLTPSGLEIAVAPRALSSDSRAIVEANLSLVEQAERELQQALKQQPESTTLRSLLRSAEHRQRALRAML